MNKKPTPETCVATKFGGALLDYVRNLPAQSVLLLMYMYARIQKSTVLIPDKWRWELAADAVGVALMAAFIFNFLFFLRNAVEDTASLSIRASLRTLALVLAVAAALPFVYLAGFNARNILRVVFPDAAC